MYVCVCLCVCVYVPSHSSVRPSLPPSPFPHEYTKPHTETATERMPRHYLLYLSVTLCLSLSAFSLSPYLCVVSTWRFERSLRHAVIGVSSVWSIFVLMRDPIDTDVHRPNKTQHFAVRNNIDVRKQDIHRHTHTHTHTHTLILSLSLSLCFLFL